MGSTITFEQDPEKSGNRLYQKIMLEQSDTAGSLIRPT